MLHRIGWAALVVWGCGGSAPPKSPSAADAPTSGAEEAAPQSREGGDGAASGADRAAEASTGAASSADVQAVLQLVLDDDALGPYLHLERPDRFPLRVAGRDLPQGIELTKATKPVVIVADADGDKKPLIVFTEINVASNEASVRFRYDVEKVRGSASLERRDKQWVLVRSRVTEH